MYRADALYELICFFISVISEVEFSCVDFIGKFVCYDKFICNLYQVLSVSFNNQVKSSDFLKPVQRFNYTRLDYKINDPLQL